MSSFLLKNNDILNVTIDTKVGYVIRLNKYNGATFTVDINGNVQIGQSSRMAYDYNDLCAMMNEVEEGRVYMARVKLSGGYPQVEKGSSKYIKYKDLSPFCVYEDESGRLILWFGYGKYHYISGGGLRATNRLDCPYLYGVCKDKSVLQDGRLSVDTVNRILMLNFTGFTVDSYATKPRKLVRKVASFANCFKIGICDSLGKLNSVWTV